MSQHPSLKASSFGTRHRNVLKRYERIKRLMLAERWDPAKSPFGLAKVRSIKIKVRKAKAAAPKAEGAAAPAAGTPPAPKQQKRTL